MGILVKVEFLVHLAVLPYTERKFYFPSGQAHKHHYQQRVGGNSYRSGIADDDDSASTIALNSDSESEEGAAMNCKLKAMVEAAAARIRAAKLLVREQAKLKTDTSFHV